MNQAIIKIGSYTLAMRGCELLRQHGIPCEWRKCADPKGQVGCLYTLSVAERYRWRAESILRNAGIMVLP
ncbi:MAG: hypothetical protein IIY93_09460 [Clostridia bacterium]|nr:hypothetical protein [Clostridia bacterium]MBQ4395906.1 hypothetical protein [Clostridia bacterium]MBQ5545270.1 hypothetical protein [Clostridia bacterium]